MPEVTTPEDLAKHLGWSARNLRTLARKIGACHIMGNRMVLTQDDVDQIMQATKPKPTADKGDGLGDYERLKAELERRASRDRKKR